MGSSPSLPLPSLPTANFICMTFTWCDKITLFYVSQEEIDICRQAILAHWQDGIEKEKICVPIENTDLLCYKFQLKGGPFTLCSNHNESIQMHRMTSKLLVDFYNAGWRLVVSSSLSRTSDHSTWFFERNVVKPCLSPMFSIEILSTDELQINDCPEHIFKLLQNIIRKNWDEGIQKDKEYSPGTHKIKLKGHPWRYVSKKESCSARYLIQEIVSDLWNNQWVLYGTGNFRSEADMLFFMHDEGQISGQEFIGVSLNQNDCIRLIYAPDHVISSFDDFVRMNWSKGIAEVKDKRPLFYEMRLTGSPWWADGSEAIASRKLIVMLMERMVSIGYYPISGIDISRKLQDKSLLVFKRGPPMQTQFFCLSLSSTDLIRIINAPPNATEVCKKIINNWKKGLQEEQKHYDGVSFQAKLRGIPWSCLFYEDGYHGRALLLDLWTSLRNLGWRLVCSADVSAKYLHQDKGSSYPEDVHSWYFMYDESLLAFKNPEQLQPVPNQPPPDYRYFGEPPSYDEAVKY